jgi:hypothetical protein
MVPKRKQSGPAYRPDRHAEMHRSDTICFAFACLQDCGLIHQCEEASRIPSRNIRDDTGKVFRSL